MTRRPWRSIVLAAAAASLVACSSESSETTAGEIAKCRDPRPQLCTADYNPVCGVRGDGTEKTYSNACSACADPAVTGHRPGACE